MTSWSRLIEKIHGLCHAFEEDLLNSCRQLSDEPTALINDRATISAPSEHPATLTDDQHSISAQSHQPSAFLNEQAGTAAPADHRIAFTNNQASISALSDQQTALVSDQTSIPAPSDQLISQQLKCHDAANVHETVELRPTQLKSCNRWTVAAGDDVLTSVEKMPLHLQPRKSKSGRQLQKKYKYVNKKFIVCKETRRDERAVELVGKESCKQSAVHDPFEFVGTQTTPTSSAEAHDRYNSRTQLGLFENPSVDTSMQLERSEVDGKVAVVRQKGRHRQCRVMENGLKQLVEDIADAETYSLIISQQCSTKSQNKHQISDAHNEAHCDLECVPDRQSTGSGFVNVQLSADKQTEPGVLCRAEENHSCANDVAHADSDSCVKMNVDTEQLHSALIPSTCSAADSRETAETERSDAVFQVHASQTMLCTVGADVPHAVSVNNDSMSPAVRRTSSAIRQPHSADMRNSELNVLSGMQHSRMHSTAMRVAMVSAPNTLQHDGHLSLPSISADGCNKISAKRSYKRHRAAQPQKGENKCFASRRLRKVKRKSANIIASDVEDDSSG